MGKPAVSKRRRRGAPLPQHHAQPARPTPSWAQIRSTVQALALQRGDLGGYPMVQPGLRLELAPGFPYQEMGRYFPAEGEQPQTHTCTGVDEGELIANHFWSKRLGAQVWIVWGGGELQRSPMGGKPYLRPARTEVVIDRVPMHNRRLDMLLSTGVAALAWDFAAEETATERLAELIGPNRLRMYLLTGSFIETSKRSGVRYIFRRLRPTLALGRTASGDKMQALAALCMHPIAYYADTHAGAMVPTDDVIAHLLMMRGDEHLYWRRCNQHPLWKPEAGV